MTPFPPPDPRNRARALADEALAQGAPSGWFEALYQEAGGDVGKVPWADGLPNPDLAAWTGTPRALEGVRRAVVVGAGLGDDAEHLAALGPEVLAFDVSPTAIRWARSLHPDTRVRYEVADLFALPDPWRGTFDLAVEVYTLQALPRAVRHEATRAIVSLLAPAGRLFLFTRLRDDGPTAAPYDERTAGPPWPLGRRELAGLLAGLDVVEPLRETPDPSDPSLVRGVGVWRPRPSP